MTPKQKLLKIKEEVDSCLVGGVFDMNSYRTVVTLLVDTMKDVDLLDSGNLQKHFEESLDHHTSNPDEPNDYDKAILFCKEHSIPYELSNLYDGDCTTLIVQFVTEESLTGSVYYYIPYDKPYKRVDE
jgi:hypothetical protein